MPAKNARRDVLRELVQLVRVPADGPSIGPFLAANANELAPLLSTTATDLEASATLTDGQLVTRLGARVESARLRDAEARAGDRVRDAQVAAERLAAAAQWDNGRAVFPVPLFFSRQLWSVPRQHGVVVADGFEAVVRREVVTDARTVVPRLPASEVFVDEDGLHLRWCNGRGQLNLRARPLEREERARAVIIALTRASPAATVARRVGAPMLLGDILAELGLG